MENRDVRRRDSRHTPSPPHQSQQQQQSQQLRSQRGDAFQPSNAAASSNEVVDADSHPRVAPQTPMPSMHDTFIGVELANRERRLRSDAAEADGGDSLAGAAAAAAAAAAISVPTTSAVGHERYAGRAPPSDRPAAAGSSRRRHHSGEGPRNRIGLSAAAAGGEDEDRAAGNELGVISARRSPSLSPPARRLQRELSLQPSQPDRNPIPRIASLTLSNQQWVSASVEFCEKKRMKILIDQGPLGSLS